MTLWKNFSQEFSILTLSISSIVTWIFHFSLEPTLIELLSSYWNTFLHGSKWLLHFQIWRSSLNFHLDLNLWSNTSILPSSIGFFTWLPGHHILISFLPFQWHLFSLCVGFSSSSYTWNLKSLDFYNFLFILLPSHPNQSRGL